VVVLDAGFFVALGKRDFVARELLGRLRDRASFVTAACTISEFWRDHRGLAETRFGLLRPTVVDIDRDLAKRAGALLKASRGRNAMDALVVAVAERLRARQIYTSDTADVESFLRVAARWPCEVVPV
jgi:predicted nucleic acid-binding protein